MTASPQFGCMGRRSPATVWPSIQTDNPLFRQRPVNLSRNALVGSWQATPSNRLKLALMMGIAPSPHGLTSCYWPPVAPVIVIGRFNSITSSVPAGSIAERCLPSQCATVTVAPTAPPMSRPLPPPARPPMSIAPPVPMPTSVRSLPSRPAPLNWPSGLTSLPRPRLVSTSEAFSMNLSPFGSTRFSGKMAMVGLPAMRRGSLAFVTRPSTVAPMGITVLPSTTTASVTLAENGSPAFELKVASVVSSFILTAVPVGRAVCAHAKLAIKMSDVSENVLFMLLLTSKKSIVSLSKSKQSRYDFIDRRAVELVIAAIEVAHRAAAIDHESSRVRDVDGIRAERVMQSVGFGHSPILVEQKDAGDGMLFQKFPRPPHAVPLFGGNER